MSRRPVVAGNWKMNPASADEAVALARDVAARVAGGSPLTVLCPPTIWLSAVAEAVTGQQVRIGAQNMAAEESGAYTGETSPLMLRRLAEFAIIGHSERRRLYGETDEGVRDKVASAVAHGIRPIAAVGERLEERQAGSTAEVVERQTRAAIGRLDRIAGSGLVIAYEPVWAIGTGEAATDADAQEASALIRATLAELDPTGAEEVPILYGGSVTADNAAGFFAQPDVDGALVGGASLQAAGFAAIVAAAARVSNR